MRLIIMELSLSYATVEAIIAENLALRKVCVKFVPKMSERIRKRSNLLANVVPGDATWCFQYCSKMKRQSSEFPAAKGMDAQVQGKSNACGLWFMVFRSSWWWTKGPP